MQITLIRHLPTEWNEKTLLQGRRDIGITTVTDDFYKGIVRNQQHLKKLSPFDLVLASSLKRTHQTANHYGFQPETEALLDELDFGPFEGHPKEKLFEKHGDIWIENPKKLVLGESIKDFEGRIYMFLQKYNDFHNILVFGHGSWIRAMVSYHNYGHINNMNRVTVENNACITLSMN